MTASHSPSSTRRRFVQGTAAAAASTFFIGRARAADPEFTMKIATVAPPGTPWAKQLKEVKTKIQDGSGGRIKVKTYLGGALGDEIATAEATKRGSIQCYGGSTAALSSAVPELAVIELPYLFETEKVADEILDNVIWDDLVALLAKRDLVLSFFSENGYRSIGANFAIKTPADLKGKKMRSQESDVHLDTWRAFGASPQPIAVTEVLTSLQTGVVDGFDNTPLFTFAASWHQAISHFTLTNHIYQPGIIVLSKTWFDTLPADLQTLVQGDRIALAKAGRRGVRAIKGMLLRNFTDAGISLVELTDGERSAFKAKAPEVWDKFAAATSSEGKAILDKIKAAL